jgi:hypothetical protein
MANISDARGSLELKGPWKPEHIKAWVYLIDTQRYGYYTITLGADSFKEAYQELKKNKNIDFTAFGRWAFEANLLSLERWAKNEDIFEASQRNIEISNKITYEEYLEKIKWLLLEMYTKDLTIEWDFIDSEFGANFLLHETGVHKSQLNSETGMYELVFHGDVQGSWDPNLKNMCQQFYEDNSDLVEAVTQLMFLYKLPKEYENNLYKLIENESDWYNLGGWPLFENFNDVPEKLHQDITARIKGEVPW